MFLVYRTFGTSTATLETPFVLALDDVCPRLSGKLFELDICPCHTVYRTYTLITMYCRMYLYYKLLYKDSSLTLFDVTVCCALGILAL